MTHYSTRRKTALSTPAMLPVRAVVMAIALATVAPQLYAQSSNASSGVTRHSYQVAPGPLANALTDFASQAGVTVQFKPALTDDLRSAGLSGEYSVNEGFVRLLQGSGLSAAERGNRVYVLSPEVGDAALLEAVTVMGNRNGRSPFNTRRD